MSKKSRFDGRRSVPSQAANDAIVPGITTQTAITIPDAVVSLNVTLGKAFADALVMRAKTKDMTAEEYGAVILELALASYVK